MDHDETTNVNKEPNLASGIGRRVLILIVLFSSVITLVLTLLQLYLDYRHDLSVIDKRFDEVEESHLTSLARNLWNMDSRTVKLQMEGIVRLPDMQALKFREKSPSLATETLLVIEVGEWEDRAVISRSFPVLYNGNEIGNLDVQASLRGVYERLINKGIVILISQGIKTFIVSFFILYIVHRLITRHIETISRFVSNYSPTRSLAPLELNRQRPAKPDEFDQMVAAFNKMRWNLQDTYDQLCEANADLVIKQERFDKCLNYAKAGVWEWDMENDVLYWSKQVWSIFGYEIEKDVATVDDFFSRIHPDDLKMVKSEIRKSIVQNVSYVLEHRIILPDGAIRWVVLRGDTTRDESGRASSMLGTAVDRTKRKTAEQQIKRAKEEAENASAAKSQFLASMSHELRTPLNAVLGYGQLLQLQLKDSLSELHQQGIENILLGGNHLLELVSDILDLAQIEADRISISIEVVDAPELIEECLRQTRYLYEERDIRIVDRYSDINAPLIRTDPLRLKQVVINLLSNAAKFNQKGGSIIISAKETLGGFLQVSITDTGMGITNDRRDGIFELFQRFDPDPEVACEGTGIGLTVSKMLMEKLGGWIWFESEVGVGSTFSISLPLATNDSVLIWTDDLRVGIDAIDRDHQVLCKLSNEVWRDLNDEDMTFENNLDRFVELITQHKLHLQREDAILEVCDHPEFMTIYKANQVQLHQIDTLLHEWRLDQDGKTRQRLEMVLKNCLTHHIANANVKLRDYTSGKEVEISQTLENFF